jgi:hypothetical protein
MLSGRWKSQLKFDSPMAEQVCNSIVKHTAFYLLIEQKNLSQMSRTSSLHQSGVMPQHISFSLWEVSFLAERLAF